MISNVVIVSGVEQSDSVIHEHVSILSQILFPFRLSLSVEQGACALWQVLAGYPF